jgi:hypothetical protein
VRMSAGQAAAEILISATRTTKDKGKIFSHLNIII